MAGRFSRLSQIGALTTRVSSSYLGQRISAVFQGEEESKAALEKLHAQNAERIVARLGTMKGAAMKVGQALAQVADGLDLPGDARDMLAKLHDKAEPVPFAAIRRRIEHELQGELTTLFRSLDEAPLGTASLGQAHAAVLPDGTDVVVKVLHEGIEDSVNSDLGALKTMMIAGKVLRRPREEIDAIFLEIEDRLREELDYTQEAANIKEIRSFFLNDPDVLTPRVFDGWSTAKVLTMSRVPGRPLSVFAATSSEAVRSRAGVTLGRAFMTMQYVHRTLHADPHPGNYLFSPDGKVGILDFGCVRRFDPRWMVTYGATGFHAVRGEREPCLEAAQKIGALTQRDPVSDQALWELCDLISAPFRGGPFLMGGPEDEVQDKVTRLMPRVLAAPHLRAPRELVFLHRGLGGTHQILKQLKARGDWGEMFFRFLEVCRRDAARLPPLPASA